MCLTTSSFQFLPENFQSEGWKFEAFSPWFQVSDNFQPLDWMLLDYVCQLLTLNKIVQQLSTQRV